MNIEIISDGIVTDSYLGYRCRPCVSYPAKLKPARGLSLSDELNGALPEPRDMIQDLDNLVPHVDKYPRVFFPLLNDA